MSYSTKRRFKSRREKREQTLRNFRIIVIFSIIGGAILLFKNRVAIWDWLKIYFYY